MLLAALALATAQASVPSDCRRSRSGPDLQLCEVERSRHDILDSVQRPSATILGQDVIRFSSAPALGGRGLVVELVSEGSRGAVGRLFWLYGHPGLGWEMRGGTRIRLTSERYSRLATVVDQQMARSEPLPSPAADEPEVMFVCTDGPGYLTERVRHGQIVTLAGSCGDEHPNDQIGALLLQLLCPAFLGRNPGDQEMRQRCAGWRAAARQLESS